MTTTEDREYLPAMSRPTLLRVLRRDQPVARRAGGAVAAGRAGGVEPGATVVEIGTGTGDVLLLATRAVPDATVIGLDPDRCALALADRKLPRGGVTVSSTAATPTGSPTPTASVDRVLSAFMLHHLPADQQHAALREVRRVLAPGGRLHLLDIDGSAPSPPAGSAARPPAHRRAARGSARAACARRPRRRARRLHAGRPGGRRRGRPRRDAVGRVRLLPRGPLKPYRRYQPPGPASAVAAAGPQDPGA